jgi:hypothetical protein
MLRRDAAQRSIKEFRIEKVSVVFAGRFSTKRTAYFAM